MSTTITSNKGALLDKGNNGAAVTNKSSTKNDKAPTDKGKDAPPIQYYNAVEPQDYYNAPWPKQLEPQNWEPTAPSSTLSMTATKTEARTGRGKLQMRMLAPLGSADYAKQGGPQVTR